MRSISRMLRAAAGLLVLGSLQGCGAEAPDDEALEQSRSGIKGAERLQNYRSCMHGCCDRITNSKTDALGCHDTPYELELCQGVCGANPTLVKPNQSCMEGCCTHPTMFTNLCEIDSTRLTCLALCSGGGQGGGGGVGGGS